MNEIDDKQITTLMALFNEVGESKKIVEIYDSLEESYNLFMKVLPDLIEKSKIEPIYSTVHLLKNKLRSLGMSKSTTELDLLFKSIEARLKGDADVSISTIGFSESVSKSMRYFSEKYLL